jgi:ABC-2 type transport system permease protein
MALYRLLLRNQATTGRVLALCGLGLVGALLGFAIGTASAADPLDDGTILISTFGLSLFVPVTSLVLASSVLGEPNEDGTLVYLWLRPIARWRIAAVAMAAALTVVVPVAVAPLALAAALTGAGSGLVAATVASVALASVAYTAVFTLLGLRVQRALVWGLAYILVWEGFVARAGSAASQLAIRSHTRSVLTILADGPERLADVSLATGVVVPLTAAAVAAGLTVRRLSTQDVR